MQQPVAVTLASTDGELYVRNRYDFLSLAHLDGSWALLDDGVPVAAGPLGPLSAGPGETEPVAAGPLPPALGEAVLQSFLPGPGARPVGGGRSPGRLGPVRPARPGRFAGRATQTRLPLAPTALLM